MAPKAYPGFVVNATHYVHPNKVDEYLTHLRPAWEAVIAEPENIFFDVFVDPSEPGKIRLFEIWTKDKEWFMSVQLQKEYYKPYREAVEPLWVKPCKFDPQRCGTINKTWRLKCAPVEIDIQERLEGWCAYGSEFLKDAKKTG